RPTKIKRTTPSYPPAYWILDDRDQGLSLGDIARRYGFSKSAIQRLCDYWQRLFGYPVSAWRECYKKGWLTRDGTRLTTEGENRLKEQREAEDPFGSKGWYDSWS